VRKKRFTAEVAVDARRYAKASERLSRHRVPLRILRVLCGENVLFFGASRPVISTVSLPHCEFHLVFVRAVERKRNASSCELCAMAGFTRPTGVT